MSEAQFTASLDALLDASILPAPTTGSQPGSLTAAPSLNSGQFTFSMPSTRSTSQPPSVVGSKRPASEVISEDEGELHRRRQDRNLREQQRSQKITQQIDVLKELLTAANVDFKSDKYSTLVSVVDYIRDLQERSARLDKEHRGLLDTIAQTTEMVHGSHNASPDLDGRFSPLEDEGAMNGIDYHSVFASSPLAVAITSIDGRFVDCNRRFEALCGFSRSTLIPLESKPSAIQPTAPEKNLSLFNVLQKEAMQPVFVAMSDMLKRPVTPGMSATDEDDFWAGEVAVCRRDSTTVCTG